MDARNSNIKINSVFSANLRFALNNFRRLLHQSKNFCTFAADYKKQQ